MERYILASLERMFGKKKQTTFVYCPKCNNELVKNGNLIEEYKPKYIYQRYNGEIRQFEVVNDNYLVDTKSGMSFDFRSHLMLGKVSEKLKDLIEISDLVKIEDNCGAIHWFEVYENSGIYQYDILEIATKEMMESISYKVKEIVPKKNVIKHIKSD